MRGLRFLLLFFGIFCCGVAFPQRIDISLEATALKKFKDYKKGETIQFSEFNCASIQNFQGAPTPYYHEFYLHSVDGNIINLDKSYEDTFKFHCHSIQNFWDAVIIQKVAPNLYRQDYQFELRRDMEEDALEYIHKVKAYDLELKDPYLESYLYTLVSKIAPKRLLDGRPCNVNLVIQQSPEINASTYPNGTIVLNTGLLSILHSEDELVAILSHEIAHFVLDHSVININAENKRIERAKFWSGLLTGITAVAEVAVAAQSDYYIPGGATLGVAALSSTISQSVVKQLGMKFNHEQEEEADEVACKITKFLGYDENALATALHRIEQQYIRERNNAIYVSSYSHPALQQRIEESGVPKELRNSAFEQKVSFAVTSLAAMKYEDRRFSQCEEFVTQNIENHVATSDDYILKASCRLALEDSPQSNREVLDLIRQAKEINTGALINIYSTEIVANLRLNQKQEALDLLNEYLVALENLLQTTEKVHSDRVGEQTFHFVTTETDWAKRMLVKLQGMI